KSGPDDGEGATRPTGERAPFTGDHRRERERSERDGGGGENPDPQPGSERVVQKAVVDEAVTARVPKVVPEPEAVVDEARPLVRVRGKGRAGRGEPDEHCRDRGSG